MVLIIQGFAGKLTPNVGYLLQQNHVVSFVQMVANVTQFILTYSFNIIQNFWTHILKVCQKLNFPPDDAVHICWIFFFTVIYQQTKFHKQINGRFLDMLESLVTRYIMHAHPLIIPLPTCVSLKALSICDIKTTFLLHN